MADWSLAAGSLDVVPAAEHPELLADPVQKAVQSVDEQAEIGACAIEPDLADTAEFCAHYGSPPELSANCVIVAGKRAGEVRRAACLVLATTRADVNGVVKRWLEVRKASFAAMDDAVALTGMERGGITPFGLPEGWPVLVDAAVARAPVAVVGSGLRRSKIIAPGRVLADLPGAAVVDGLGQPVS
jgi:prolyl-tRNA editing enzyme YbaK/EbsC (Cys-tRNA(Pro) deacylase)